MYEACSVVPLNWASYFKNNELLEIPESKMVLISDWRVKGKVLAVNASLALGTQNKAEIGKKIERNYWVTSQF